MATKVTNDYPGKGWIATGYKTINGVRTTIWTYNGDTGTTGTTGATGGNTGHTGGASGGASGGSGDTPEKKAKRVAQWTRFYWGLVEKAGGKLSKEAKRLIEWAAKTEQMPSSTAFIEQMRKWDEVGYLKTSVAEKRGADILIVLRDVFKASFDLDNKEIKALLVKWQLGEPDKYTESDWFRLVMRSKLFRTANPEFNKWWNQRTGLAAQAGGDPYAGFVDYQKLRDNYINAYTTQFGSAAVIPPDLLSAALLGNWALDGAQWKEAIAADSSWGTLTGYTDRVKYFQQQWTAIFGASAFKDIAPPADLMKKFGQGTMTFDELFQTSIRGSVAFQTAFPEFEIFAQATFERTGTPMGTISITDWLRRRADFVERYKSIIEDPNGVPDPTLLAQALAGNWSDTQWDLTIEKNDPKFKTTEAFKAKENAKLAKGSSFDQYWKRIFGENSPVDAGLRAEYMASAENDPSALWDDIKNTSEFQSQYAQWDAFSAAQNAQGVSVMDNPGLYKEYQKAFYDAFANQGIQAPSGFDRMFFSSGIDSREFANNVAQFAQQQESYQWQTGETADLATASGVGDKTAGGSLRKRLDEAIKQHQAFAQSKFKDFQTQEVAGNLTQRV